MENKNLNIHFTDVLQNQIIFQMYTFELAQIKSRKQMILVSRNSTQYQSLQ